MYSAISSFSQILLKVFNSLSFKTSLIYSNSLYKSPINPFKSYKQCSQFFVFIPFIEIKITGYLPCSEIYTDFSISNPLNNFLFSLAFFISKKYFKVDIFKVLPNLLGRMKSLTSAASSKSSVINLVLSI